MSGDILSHAPLTATTTIVLVAAARNIVGDCTIRPGREVADCARRWASDPRSRRRAMTLVGWARTARLAEAPARLPPVARLHISASGPEVADAGHDVVVDALRERRPAYLGFGLSGETATVRPDVAADVERESVDARD
jgi:hypothetical protein